MPNTQRLRKAPAKATKKPLLDPEKYRKAKAPAAEEKFSEAAQTTIPVRKPGSRNFFRVHPDEEYRLYNVPVVEDDKHEVHILAADLEIPEDLERFVCHVNLITCLNHKGTLFLWCSRTPQTTGRSQPAASPAERSPSGCGSAPIWTQTATGSKPHPPSLACNRAGVAEDDVRRNLQHRIRGQMHRFARPSGNPQSAGGLAMALPPSLTNLGIRDVIVLDAEYVHARASRSSRFACAPNLSPQVRSGAFSPTPGVHQPCPLPMESDILYVSFSAPAEWSYFLASGWELPPTILDLYAEEMLLTNTQKDERASVTCQHSSSRSPSTVWMR